jgi:hypothetical protein
MTSHLLANDQHNSTTSAPAITQALSKSRSPQIHNPNRPDNTRMNRSVISVVRITTPAISFPATPHHAHMAKKGETGSGTKIQGHQRVPFTPVYPHRNDLLQGRAPLFHAEKEARALLFLQ